MNSTTYELSGKKIEGSVLVKIQYDWNALSWTKIQKGFKFNFAPLCSR